MSEINTENLLKRAAMLESDNEFVDALELYERILEVEPDNDTAYRRRKAIKNSTLTIIKETIPMTVAGTDRRYFITLDGERVGDFFLASVDSPPISVTTSLGKHKLTLCNQGFANDALPKENFSYEFTMTENDQKIYFRYVQNEEHKFGEVHFTHLAHEEGAKNGKIRGEGATGGCYVATVVYGSYDCPQVWTLRRFRDNTLAETWYGRAFIRTYYAISPTLAKWFGKAEWFKNLWKPCLDRMVEKLNGNGVEDTPYDDKTW